MTKKIVPFILGPIENNSYIYIDWESKTSIVVDPSFGSKVILDYAADLHIEISAIWCTHAHFDHISGVNEIMPLMKSKPEILLHEDDLPLWKANGGANTFGFPFENNYLPTRLINKNQSISVGSEQFMIKHTPGHTPGHIIFYHPGDQVVFCGDLIFHSSVGRTDLPGGSHSSLIKSIFEEILTLRDQTRLLSGHGQETTVGYERWNNPFLTVRGT